MDRRKLSKVCKVFYHKYKWDDQVCHFEIAELNLCKEWHYFWRKRSRIFGRPIGIKRNRFIKGNGTYER